MGVTAQPHVARSVVTDLDGVHQLVEIWACMRERTPALLANVGLPS